MVRLVWLLALMVTIPLIISVLLSREVRRALVILLLGNRILVVVHDTGIRVILSRMLALLNVWGLEDVSKFLNLFLVV